MTRSTPLKQSAMVSIRTPCSGVTGLGIDDACLTSGSVDVYPQASQLPRISSSTNKNLPPLAWVDSFEGSSLAVAFSPTFKLQSSF